LLFGRFGISGPHSGADKMADMDELRDELEKLQGELTAAKESESAVSRRRQVSWKVR
jgi:hypothetical protein